MSKNNILSAIYLVIGFIFGFKIGLDIEVLVVSFCSLSLLYLILNKCINSETNE